MPQLIHGFVGLAVAAATARRPRSPVLRNVWPGGLVLLAYGPDVVEWVLQLCGIRLPHSAVAGLLPLTGMSIVTVLLFRVVFHEVGWGSATTAVAVLWSHTLLDAMSGGVPLFWPFSTAIVGTRWLDWSHSGIGGSLLRELPLGLLTLAIGVLIARHDGAAFRRGWSIWSLIAAIPVIAMGATKVYEQWQLSLGLTQFRAGQFEEALRHNRRADAACAIGAHGTALVRCAECYQAMGMESAAWECLTLAMQRFPDSDTVLSARAQFHLSAQDARYYDPVLSAEVAEGVMNRSTSEAERTFHRGLLERARDASRSTPDPTSKRP